MRALSFLFTFLILCQNGFTSQPQNNLRSAAEEDDALFQPVDGMYTGLDDSQLQEIERKKLAEVNTFQRLIGQARVEELEEMLLEAKTEKKAGCIVGWSAKGLTAASGITSALSTALGAPSWITYITAAVTVLTPVVMHISESLKDDANKTKKEVIKCYAASIKDLHQIQEARRAKAALASEKESNLKLAKQVDRIQKRLFSPQAGDVVLNMDGDSEDAGEEDDSKGKEDVTPKPKTKAKKLVKHKKSKAAVPPKPQVPSQQTGGMVPVTSDEKLKE